jgi:hypothetical protein
MIQHRTRLPQDFSSRYCTFTGFQFEASCISHSLETMAASTPTTRRVLSEININTATARGVKLLSKLSAGSPAKLQHSGQTTLQTGVIDAWDTAREESPIGSRKRNSEGGSDGVPTKRYKTPSRNVAGEAMLDESRRGQNFGFGMDGTVELPSPPSRVCLYDFFA